MDLTLTRGGHNRTADLSQLLQPTLHPMQSTVTGRAVFWLRCMTVGRSPAGVTGCQRSVKRITVRRQHNGTIGKLSDWNNRPERLSSDSPTIGRYDSTMGLSS